MAERDSCPDEDVLVSLALGELAGRARADALAHLDACPRCRDRVEALIDITEQVLLAAPEAEPPAGFEISILSRMRPERPAARRRPALAVLAAAAALVPVALVGGRFLTRGPDHLAEAAMVTPSGRDVGEVWRYDQDQSWIFVSVPGWKAWDDAATPAEFRLRGELDDGSTVDLGRITFGTRDGSWGTTTDVDAGEIRSVAVVDRTGHVWCEGEF